jgi:hypothetical protein
MVIGRNHGFIQRIFHSYQLVRRLIVSYDVDATNCDAKLIAPDSVCLVAFAV